MKQNSKLKKKIVSFALSVWMVLTATTIPVVSAVVTNNESTGATTSVSETGANSYGLASNIQDGTILHCFDWKYNDIKAELKNIAEAGFTSVQTSPAQKGGGSGTWWWLYQPLGFSVQTNDLGTKDELKSLCEEAEKYGIKVVVDVVANHLAGDHSNIQSDLKDSQYWHTFGGNVDWSNRWQVTHGEIGMPDLNSEHSYVQQVVANYINELKDIGVDGIRWDAAKHIALPSEGCGFWPAVTSQGLWHYGEILAGPDDRSSGNEGLMKEYTNYMTVTDSNYGKTLRDSFNSGQAPDAYGNWSARGVSNNKLIYWAESHDTWSNNDDWGYSNGMSQNVIDRAYAVAASRDDITALYFSRPASKVKDDIKAGQKGSTHFTSKEVAAVNHFHNAMIGQKDYYKSSNGCAVVCREEGVVIAKGSGSGSVTVENGGSTTKPGTYIDEITGNTWTVTSSTISGTIGSSGIAVIYNPKTNPQNTISKSGGSFKTDSLTLELGLSNATSGTYQINGGTKETYTGTKSITIGAGDAYGTQYKIDMTATDGTESTSASYTFTKVDPNAVQKVYFDNSSYNWSSVYVYIYTGDGESSSSLAKWPGTAMSKDSKTGYYSLEVPEEYSNGMVIFTESSTATTNRYPADMEPGLSLNGSSMLFSSGNSWKEYTEITTTVTTQPTTALKTYLYGDVNLDNIVDTRDAVVITKANVLLVTLSDIQKKAADVNGDGYVDVKDATLIQKYSINLITSLPVGSTFTAGSTVTVPPTTKPTTTTKQTTTVPTTTKPSTTYTITFSNNKHWSGTLSCYYWSDSDKPVQWPGTAMTKSYTNDFGEDVYTIDIPSNMTNFIITNGSTQTVDIPLSGSAKYYIDGESNGKSTVANWT